MKTDLLSLPIEILISIVCLLDFPTKIILRSTCKRLEDIINRKFTVVCIPTQLPSKDITRFVEDQITRFSAVSFADTLFDDNLLSLLPSTLEHLTISRCFNTDAAL